MSTVKVREDDHIRTAVALDSSPLSYAQQRIWLRHQLEHDSTEYNMLWAQRMRGKLDIPALRKAVNTIVRRHEPLRTRISNLGGRIVQWVVERPADLDIPVEDLTALDAAAQAVRITDALRREGNAPIDLAQGPMLRFRLLKLAEQEYVWLRVFHHINYDGWSDGVFCRELNALYDAFSQDGLNPLVPLPLNYRDFAAWQHESVAETVTPGLEYWRNQLAGIPAHLELPLDRTHGAASHLGCGLHNVQLSEDQIAGIKRLSRASGGTSYMTMLTGFALLLSRYTGQDDIVVGTPIANRRLSVLENMIGCFVNALPLRVRLSQQLTFRDLLNTVRETALAAYDHQDVPFERIVEDLAPRRDPYRPPIFQAFFSMQDTPFFPLRLRGMEIDPPFRGERIRSRFDLELSVSLNRGEPNLCWFYNRNLFDDWRIEQLAQHYVALIDEIIAHPDVPVSQLDLLGPRDRKMLLEEFNPSGHDLLEVSLPALFEKQVQKAADATAIVFNDTVLTYGKLNKQANHVATLLQSRGVQTDDIVAVAMERTPGLAVAMLGVLKCGAAVLPLEPDSPPARLAFMLSDARPRFVLTDAASRSQLPAIAAETVVDISQALPGGTHRGSHDLSERERDSRFGASAAYVIYTSGSTGKPKAVVGTASALLNRLLWIDRVYPFRREEPVLARTSVAFIDGLTELLGALSHGAPVVLADSSSAKDASALIELARRERVSRITLVPSLLSVMLESPLSRELMSCRLWISSGEALLPSQVKRFSEVLPGSELLNLYGCSECAGDSLFARCESPDVMVGKPISNTRVYIANGMQLVPLGVAGELYIGGAGVARGYSGQPGLTAERFVPDPYGPPGGRIYRTGDVARWRRDANAELLGRADRQIKIRGQRIELAEIEAALRTLPSVRDAVVIPWQDTAEGTRLAGYVVAGANSALEAQELRRQLTLLLPDYMIPASLQAIAFLPTLPNGKLDLRALPAPSVLPLQSSRCPRSEREAVLCTLFAEVLGVEHIGIDDDFFAMGGHSLLATSLINRIREMFGVELTLRRVFETGTVANLSEQWQ